MDSMSLMSFFRYGLQTKELYSQFKLRRNLCSIDFQLSPNIFCRLNYIQFKLRRSLCSIDFQLSPNIFCRLEKARRTIQLRCEATEWMWLIWEDLCRLLVTNTPRSLVLELVFTGSELILQKFWILFVTDPEKAKWAHLAGAKKRSW